jgi:hypothetical protein
MSEPHETAEFEEIRASVRALKERAADLLRAAAELELASADLAARIKQVSKNAQGTSRANRSTRAKRATRANRPVHYRNE